MSLLTPEKASLSIVVTPSGITYLNEAWSPGKANNLVLSFPSNLIGKMMNAQKQEYFQATSIERQNVNVQI